MGPLAMLKTVPWRESWPLSGLNLGSSTAGWPLGRMQGHCLEDDL